MLMTTQMGFLFFKHLFHVLDPQMGEAGRGLIWSHSGLYSLHSLVEDDGGLWWENEVIIMMTMLVMMIMMMTILMMMKAIMVRFSSPLFSFTCR